MKKPNSIKKKQSKQLFNLTLVFGAITFCILFATLIIVYITSYILVKSEILPIFDKRLLDASKLFPFMMITSFIIGGIVCVITTKLPFAPFNHLIKQINCLASGDYTARLKFGKHVGKHPAMETLTNSFNTMAQELQNTEMLRRDFINNFSHEFKTPIVSILGFTKLLRKGSLTAEQKEEYLTIIEKESLRLSQMATIILDLTRIENQTILTDISTFNLSEQLRSCLLLLENKWTRKNIELHVDFGEYDISANEELLKQIWINLIDNAIKFSPDYGIIEINISENENEEISVSISNNGDTIDAETAGKIFNKFYQADESHSSEGNGIGLAIVKRVVQLHNGEVYVQSKDNLTTFTVKLPKAR